MKRTIALAAAVLTAVSLIRPVSALPPPIYESSIPVSSRESAALIHRTNITGITFTDIAVTIDGASIRAYGNEYVYVYAEDLSSYGFDVVWDRAENALTIARNPAKEITAAYPQEPIPEGRTVCDLINWYTLPIRYSNIVTYVTDGISRAPIACYNHSGRMLVRLDDLAAFFGREYVWDAEARTLSLTLADRAVKPVRNTWYEAEETGDGLALYVCFTADPEAEPELYGALLDCTVEMDGEPLNPLPADWRVRNQVQAALYKAASEIVRVSIYDPLPDVGVRTHSHLLVSDARTSEYDDTVIFRVRVDNMSASTVLPTLSVEIG